VLIPEQGVVHDKDQEQAPDTAIEDLPAAQLLKASPGFMHNQAIYIYIYATLLHLMFVGLECALKCRSCLKLLVA
jgi:hypothetical protein